MSPDTLSTTEIPAGAAPSGKSGIARQFDHWAPTYEQGRLARWYQAQNRIALDHLHLPGDGRVLDIGCGTGWALRQLAYRNPAVSALGIDLSAGMIATALDLSRAEALSGLQFRVMDWEDGHTLLPDGPFDAILCISAFHYFADPLAALRKMRAALTDGGQLLIVERAMDGSLLTRLWDAAHRWLIRDHVTFASSRRLMTMAREAGFADARVTNRINRLFWNNKFYTSLVLIEAGTDGRQ